MPAAEQLACSAESSICLAGPAGEACDIPGLSKVGIVHESLACAVFGAVLINLDGCIFAWSVFTPELTAAGWTRMETQMAFAVGLVSYHHGLRRPSAGGTGSAGPDLGRRFRAGDRLSARAGLLGGTNFWAIALFVGLVGGCGIGTAYMVPIAVGMRWFPDKKGLITGLAVAGFGFGAMAWVKRGIHGETCWRPTACRER